MNTYRNKVRKNSVSQTVTVYHESKEKFCLNNTSEDKGGITMNNIELMKEVIKLDTENLKSRLHAQKNQLQLSVIRKAFGVKNGETDAKVENYERERIMSDAEIVKEFEKYIGFWKWAKQVQNNKEYEYKNSILFFIEAVAFFDVKLSETLQNNFQEIELAV